MNSYKLLKTAMLLSVIFFTISCDNKPKFTISGEVKGASDTTIYLEKRELSGVVTVDSAKIDDKGKFEIKSLAPQYPEIYALRFGSQYINLGIDSIETINIVATKDNFSLDYEVEGSINSSQMRTVALGNYEVTNSLKSLRRQYDEKAITAEAFTDSAMNVLNKYKATCVDIIVKSPKTIAAYYTLFQKIDGDLVFDPYDKKESKYYAAVATQWDTFTPDSPRAKHLKQFTLGALKTQRSLSDRESLLDSAKLIDNTDWLQVKLRNVNNREIDIADYKGKVVVLDFTIYTGEGSPEHNIVLNKAYEKFGTNIVIYQISYDADEHYWKNAAINLPWVCVRDHNLSNSRYLNLYNVQALPTTFIINKQGEVVKRISGNDNLESEIAKVL